MTVFWERLGLLVFVGLYLVIFNVNVPHGDALRIARQIAASELIWNPNHLLLDPFGYFWHSLLQALGSNISVLGGFELISALSTLLSLLLFHKILLRLQVKSSGIRLLALLGLFASKNFLSMAVSQYFFMMQMPFLLATLYFAIRFVQHTRQHKDASTSLYAMGVCMALATAIEMNNLVPVIFLGFVLAYMQTAEKPWNVNNTLKFWGAAALVGFPIFISGYIAADTDSGFISWLLAYQGESNSSLDSYYGTRMNLTSIVTSSASLVFHLFFGNFIETAGLGTVVKVLVLQQPLEFIPDTSKLILAGLLMPVVGISLLLLFIWSIRHARQVYMVRLGLVWIIAYLVFNFFWPYTSDLFWFQLLPLIWLLLIIHLGVTQEYSEDPNQRRPGLRQWKMVLLSVTVVSLLVLNTLQTVKPIAMADMEGNSLQHQSLLQEHDMEIVPGWDNYKWMMQDNGETSVNKLLLMNMALKTDTDPLHIKNLPQLVGEHLNGGHRVIVGRLYARDRESNPWSGLSDLGWPRSKIQMLLEDFCRRPLGKIDDVEFHELYLCQAPNPG
jgi:hypothetical protein